MKVLCLAGHVQSCGIDRGFVSKGLQENALLSTKWKLFKGSMIDDGVDEADYIFSDVSRSIGLSGHANKSQMSPSPARPR